ncbi:MAG: EAL domain-containing protein [Chloroflexi bacterium]|nr:MAG: EAL domain-containing protein [Chloroflexota bacterium]
MRTPTRAFEALHQIAVAAGGLREPSSLAGLVVDRARDLLSADAATLYWWYPEAHELRAIAHNDPREPTFEPPFKPGEGAAGAAFKTGRRVFVDDYQVWPAAIATSRAAGLVSAGAVPLLVAERPVGALCVFTRQPRHWTDDDENLLLLLAAQVAPALEAARLTQEATTQASIFRALHELAMATGGVQEPAELAGLVADRARDLLHTDDATLRWWDEEHGMLRLLAVSGREPREIATEVGPGQGALGQAFKRRAPALLEDYQHSPHALPYQLRLSVKSALAVPVMSQERAVGALGVTSQVERVFLPNEVQLLTLLAAQVGPALEAARLYAESERRRAEAQALAELVSRGAAEADSEKVLELVTEQAGKLAGADYSAIVLKEGEGAAQFRSWGTSSAGVAPSPDPRGHTLRVMTSRKTVVLENIGVRGGTLAKDHPFHVAEGGRTAVGTPIFSGERTVGALLLGWRSQIRPSADKLRLTEALAGYAATIIDNARAHERERSSAERAAAQSAQLAAVIDHIPSGVVVVDPEGRIVLVNQAGKGADAQPGKQALASLSNAQVRDAHTGQTVPAAELPLNRALRGEPVLDVEHIIRRKGVPGERSVKSSAVPLKDSQGRITGALSVYSDVTRERRLLRELMASEERIRSLYRMVACGVLVLDSEGRVLDANGPAQAILGSALDEMRGKGIGRLWDDVDEKGEPLPPARRPSLRALHSGKPIRNFVVGIRKKGRRDVRWVQIDTIPVLDAGGRAVEVVSSFIDISERKRVEEQLAQETAKYRLLFDANPEAMYVYDRDTLRFLAVNDTAIARYGYPRKKFLSLTIEDLLVADEMSRLRALLPRIKAPGTYLSGTWQQRKRDGTLIWVDIASHPIEFEGRPARLVMATDVSEKKAAQDRLQASEGQLRTIFEQAPIGLCRIGLDGHILEGNRPLQTMLGYSSDQLAGLSFAALLGMEGDPEGADASLEEFTAGRREHYQAERLVFTRDGSQIWVSISTSMVRGQEGEPLYLIGMCEDITDRKAQTALLEYQAMHDSLTDLPNRTLLNDRLQQALLTSQRDGRQLALLIMDLNRFKDVNDTFGHNVGDELLQQVGPRLHAQLRESDTVARLGGDEFAVVLPTAGDEAGAVNAAGRLLAALQEPFAIESQRLQIGGSIGIAISPEHGTDPATLMRRADIAMYVAKQNRVGHAVYSPEQDRHSPGRMALAGELREAIRAGQLVLHYQPQIDVRTRSLAGVEALVRWDHPRHGLMPPDEFMSLAEESGLIGQLGEWTIREALAEAHVWRAKGTQVPVAVNLSMRNLQDPELPNLVARLLEEARAAPQELKVEITETELMADPELAVAVTRRMRAMGVMLSIDDFGIGYSSLAHIRELPVNEVKIDRSFIAGLGDSAEVNPIVQSTIDLGHNLGLVVVAEGAETQAAWDTLVELECDVIQGYLLSRPVPARQLARWVAASPWAAGTPATA